MTRPVALVLGATGLVGGHCLALLADDPYYERVVSVGRRVLDTFARNPRVVQHVVDFERIPEHAAAFASDHVYCALGTTRAKAGSQEAFYRVDHGYVVETAQAAREQGATVLSVVSALGANPRSHVYYNRVKGEMEQDVSGLGFASTNILRPSLLLGARQERRLGEMTAQRLGRVLSFAIPRKFQPIHAREVAEAMILAAKNGLPGAHVLESGEITRLYRTQAMP